MERKAEVFTMGVMERLTSKGDLTPMQSVQVYKAVCAALLRHTSISGEKYFSVDLTIFMDTLSELDLYGMDADTLLDVCLGF